MEHEELKRPTREPSPQGVLFEDEPSWRAEWWGMPSFDMKDATPEHKIVVSFMTADDVREFNKRLGFDARNRPRSLWFPHQKRLNGEFVYDGTPTDSAYPVCIPSKGRADCQTTGKALDRIGVTYKFFAEETEAEVYVAHLGADKVVSMPFHDLGQGSIPARNFIWDWCRERDCKRHWTVDDNIVEFRRCHNNRRIRVHGGGFFRAMEDFVDRYENVAMAGPHHIGFAKDQCVLPPFILNSRVYSCILLDTTLQHRWRGRYNEDTDLSLRILKDGHCTVLFLALLMNKAPTSYGDANDRGELKGGNTDNVYDDNDCRRAFAESLREQHPDVVKVVWKFNRWHHQVDYSSFKNNRLRLKPGVVPRPVSDEYGMRLVRVKTDRQSPKDAGTDADVDGT